MFDSTYMYPKIPKPQENMNIKSFYDLQYKFKINPKNVFFQTAIPVV